MCYQSSIKNFASLLVDYLNTILEKSSPYDGYDKLFAIIEKFLKEFDGSSDLAKSDKQQKIIALQTKLLTEYEQAKIARFKEIEKEYLKEDLGIHSLKQRLTKIVSEWVSKKYKTFLEPEKLSLLYFLEIYPDLKTKSDEEREKSFGSRLAGGLKTMSSLGGMGALLTQSLYFYANHLGIGDGRAVCRQNFMPMLPINCLVFGMAHQSR